METPNNQTNVLHFVMAAENGVLGQSYGNQIIAEFSC